METTDQVLTEDQAMAALDVVEETETEDAEATVEEQTEADEEAVETAEDDETDGDEDPDDVEDDDADEDDEDEDEPDEGPETYSVKVDGVDVEVTLDDLKRSYSGQKFIQKGMEENATARKAVEAEYQNLQNQRIQFAQFVESIQQAGVIPEPTPPDPQLVHTDPIGYMQAHADYETQNRAYRQQQAEFQQQRQQYDELSAQQRSAFIESQKAKLLEAIPDFGDPQKAARIRDEMMSVGEQYGFSREELSGVADARTILALYDLLKFRAVNTGKRKVAEKVAKARPAAKPGNANKSAGKAKQRRETLQKLRETGSDEYALRLLDE